MRKIESSGNSRMRNPVQFARRCQVAAKWLFDNHARIPGQAGGPKPFNHRLEQRRRNRQIMCRTPRISQRLA